MARECWDKAWSIYKDTTGWKVEKGAGLEDGRVSVKHIPSMGKVFKLEASATSIINSGVITDGDIGESPTVK